jgi:predicted ATPase
MLTNLQLKNFKIWKDTKPLKMAPLTVLFGTNSSGKSSIEQFFLMLKQTMESSDRKVIIFPGDQNSPVNLGSFEELVFAREPKNKLEFNFEWSLANPLIIKDPRSDFTCSGDHLRFSADVGMAGEKHPKLAVGRLEYQLKQDGNESMRVWVERKAGEKIEYKLDASNYTLTRNQMRAWPLGPPAKFYGFPDEIPAYYQNADFVQDFSHQMEQLLRSISYLGPLRSKGERLYYWTGGEPESVGYSGENTISALLAAKARHLNTGRKKRRKPFEQFIAEKLHQLELIDAFEVKQISEHRKEYEVKVKTPGSPSWVDLPDVGFGISQVLPVLVQCFYAPADSILFIEQPELHLHPKAQSNLADLFIDVLSSRVDGRPRNIQLVIETHSEHFLHRLQRRIAENDPDRSITPDHVAAYFAHTAGADSSLEPLQIDLFGNITNWPENFFGDSMGDLMAMTQAAAARQQAQTLPTSSNQTAQ